MQINNTLYAVKRTNSFKKGYRLAKKRGLDTRLLKDIVLMLAEGRALPAKNHDHALTGNWKGFRECHIAPDWLLIYKRQDDVLVLTLTETGSHNDLDF